MYREIIRLNVVPSSFNDNLYQQLIRCKNGRCKGPLEAQDLEKGAFRDSKSSTRRARLCFGEEEVVALNLVAKMCKRDQKFSRVEDIPIPYVGSMANFLIWCA